MNIYLTLTIGGSGGSTSNALNIYSATFDVDGVILRNFNPNLYAPASSQTTIPSATGETYTINTDSNGTGYKGVLVYTTVVILDGINDHFKHNN